MERGASGDPTAENQTDALAELATSEPTSNPVDVGPDRQGTPARADVNVGSDATGDDVTDTLVELAAGDESPPAGESKAGA